MKDTMTLAFMIVDNILVLKKVYRLADENGWESLANECDEKLALLEKRAREVMGVVE